MSASVTSRSSITKPPETSRLWTPNWRITSASAGPGQATQPSASRKRRWRSRRQQRLAVVELADELEPLAQRLRRVEQPEAGPAHPGRARRRCAKTCSARNAAAAIAASSGSPKRSVPRVSTGLPKATIESIPSRAPVGGDLVAEHPALGVAADVDRRGPVSSRTRSIASSIASTWSLSERSRPPSSRSGAPKSTTQGSTPLRCEDLDRAGRGRDVVDVGREHHRRDQHQRRAVRRLRVRRPAGSSGAGGRRAARRRPRRATAPRRSRGRRSARPRARSAPRRRAGPPAQ